MGRQSKAKKARCGNLGKSKNHQNPSVDNISDDEESYFEDDDLPEHALFFLDEDSSSEEDSDDSDEELDKDELDGLMNEAKIEHFNAVLIEAQITYLIIHLISYANRAARAYYGQGLTGPEAAWARLDRSGGSLGKA
jgi:hypothetical protein